MAVGTPNVSASETPHLTGGFVATLSLALVVIVLDLAGLPVPLLPVLAWAILLGTVFGGLTGFVIRWSLAPFGTRGW